MANPRHRYLGVPASRGAVSFVRTIWICLALVALAACTPLTDAGAHLRCEAGVPNCSFCVDGAIPCQCSSIRSCACANDSDCLFSGELDAGGHACVGVAARADVSNVPWSLLEAWENVGGGCDGP